MVSSKDFIHDEANRGKERGILLPLLLAADARIPVGFGELQHIDLTHWDGTEHSAEGLQRLITRIRSLVARGPNITTFTNTLGNSEWYFNRSDYVLSELSNLTSRIRSIGELLVSDSPATKDLKGALREVGKTYDVVSKAITRFITPAIKAPINAEPFVDMERGALGTEIQNGRDHCTLILTHYGRKRIFDGRNKLAPLEKRLTKNMRKLQRLESSLGYTYPL